MTASATIRDIAIIIVAIESIFVFILLGILVWQIWRLTKLVQTEIKPVLDDARDTVNTLRSTTTFLSDNVVTPVTKASSQVAGVRRTMQVLGDGLIPRRKKTPPTA